jgi:hypothetical protein
MKGGLVTFDICVNVLCALVYRAAIKTVSDLCTTQIQIERSHVMSRPMSEKLLLLNTVGHIYQGAGVK